MSRKGKCKSCGAEIVWVRMPTAGKFMPCDVGLVPYWADLRGTDTVITPNGETVRCRLDGKPADITGIGHIPHWATCPDAEKYKRRDARGK